LLTMADSFTPRVKSPETGHKQKTLPKSINHTTGKSFQGGAWGQR
jgi:hypothetical protein